jgi:hypothetical protein
MLAAHKAASGKKAKPERPSERSLRAEAATLHREHV